MNPNCQLKGNYWQQQKQAPAVIKAKYQHTMAPLHFCHVCNPSLKDRHLSLSQSPWSSQMPKQAHSSTIWLLRKINVYSSSLYYTVVSWPIDIVSNSVFILHGHIIYRPMALWPQLYFSACLSSTTEMGGIPWHMTYSCFTLNCLPLQACTGATRRPVCTPGGWGGGPNNLAASWVQGRPKKWPQ